MKAVIAAVILLSVVLGIFLAPYFAVSMVSLIALFAILFILSFSFIPKKWLWFSTISIAFFFLGIFRYQSQEIEYFQNKYPADSQISFEGMVVEPPEMTKKATRVIIQTPKGRIMVYFPVFSDVAYGEIYSIKGKVSAMDIKTVGKYQSQNIIAIVFSPKFEKVGESKSLGVAVAGNLYALKSRIESVILELFVEPEGSFAVGLLLGVKRNLPDWLVSDLSKNGTSHIIALSGFNITIIIVSLKIMLQSQSKKLAFLLPMGVIFLFIIMTGASASVVRAGIMGSMLLVARQFGRQSSSAMAIIVTAGIMIFVNPGILRFDLGFQLSFAAVIGIIYLAPLVSVRLPIKNETAREILASTLGAQIMSFPLILLYFGTFSLVSPIVNLIILPFIPLAMFLSFVSAMLGLFWINLGYVFSWLAYAILHFIIQTNHFFAGLSFASVNNIIFLPWHLGIFYLIVFALVCMNIIFKRKNIKFGKK